MSRTEWSIVRKEELSMVKIILDSGAIRHESGALYYMKGKVELEANMPGLGQMFKSMITKEKMVKPVIKGTGEVYLEPTFGNFTILDLQDEEWILDRGAYYASDIEIEIGSYTNKAISGMFSGENWFQTAVAGTGKVVVLSSGPLEEIILVNDRLVVDGSFAVARTAGIELQVKKASKGIFSSMISGEGLVNTFTGTGKVMIAPVANKFNTLTNRLNNIHSSVMQIARQK
jgi:uncharacterized protein (TIGR00266 family)